jgi:lipopolysaccharide export system permease protein
MAPVILFSLAATVVALYINDTISPYANTQFDTIKANITSAVGDTVKPIDLPSVRDKHNHLIYLVHVDGGYDVKTLSLRNVYITAVDPASGDVTESIHAPVAKWTGGYNYTLQNFKILSSSGVEMFTPGRSLVVHYIQDPSTIKITSTPTDELDIRQLLSFINNPKRDATKTAAYEVSLCERFSLPLACFVFALVGAPLGLRPQRNAALGIAITCGLGIIFSYYALYQYMDLLAGTGHANPIFAAFLSDIRALIVGLALLRRSSS